MNRVVLCIVRRVSASIIEWLRKRYVAGAIERDGLRAEDDIAADVTLGPGKQSAGAADLRNPGAGGVGDPGVAGGVKRNARRRRQTIASELQGHGEVDESDCQAGLKRRRWRHPAEDRTEGDGIGGEVEDGAPNSRGSSTTDECGRGEERGAGAVPAAGVEAAGEDVRKGALSTTAGVAQL